MHEASKLTTKHETSQNSRNGNVNQSNNLSSARNKSLNNLDQLTSQSRVIHSTVLDSQTVLPSRFALPSKVCCKILCVIFTYISGISTLNAPIATKVVCFFSSAEMFKKPLWQTAWTQIWVHAVCSYT